MTKEIIKSIFADVQARPAIEGSIWDFFSRVSNYALIITAVFVAPLLYLLAVFYLLTAAGETDKINRAKSLFFWTTAGLIIIAVATGLFVYLARIF